METNVYVIFFLVNSRRNKKGESPIYCRITAFGKRKEFSTGIFIPEKVWDKTKNRIRGRDDFASRSNAHLKHISNSVQAIALDCKMKGKTFSATTLYKLYTGESLQEKCLLELFEVHNSYVKNLVGNGYSKATLVIYEVINKHVMRYIRKEYDRHDYPVSELSLSFITGFQSYLANELKQQASTSNKILQRLRKVIRYGIQYNWMQKDPFYGFKIAKTSKEIIFLSEEELKRMEMYTFKQTRLQQVKNIYLFACYTGLGYNELSRFSKKHLQLGFDGRDWIKMTRQKTDRLVSVPLLSSAMKILILYNDCLDDLEPNTKLLPVLSNQKLNSYIKEVADVLGIEKNLTMHTARKTFASTVLLFNDVPMHIVSELLGHSKITTTQESYGKVVQKKLSDEIGRIDLK